MGADPSLRPGVSVVLSVEMLRDSPIAAAENLRFESSVRKIGKTLSFLDCAVTTEAGEPVATGRHLKYVDMGLAWRLAFGSTLYPLTRTIARATARDPAAPEPALTPSLESLIDYACGAGLEDSATARGRFECGVPHMNDVGGIHGGYQALMHGVHGDASLAGRAATGRLRAMQVTYMTAGKRGTVDALSKTQRDGTAAAGERSTLTQSSQLVQRTTGVTLSEARLEYEVVAR